MCTTPSGQAVEADTGAFCTCHSICLEQIQVAALRPPLKLLFL